LTMHLAVVSHNLFFFQAEDGIRDFHVTGVQTCALPICHPAGEPIIGRDGQSWTTKSFPSHRWKNWRTCSGIIGNEGTACCCLNTARPVPSAPPPSKKCAPFPGKNRRR